jgi:hypothetical protein
MRPHLYELPSWQEPPGYTRGLTVERVLGELALDLGSVPAALDTEKALQSFAGTVGAPLADADIEAALIFPQYRWASRAWVAAAYADFHKWCVDTGWLEAEPTPPPAKSRKKKPEPAAV